MRAIDWIVVVHDLFFPVESSGPHLSWVDHRLPLGHPPEGVAKETPADYTRGRDVPGVSGEPVTPVRA